MDTSIIDMDYYEIDSIPIPVDMNDEIYVHI